MNFNSHVKSDKAKWIVTAIVLVLIFAILGGLCYSVISGIAPQDWFKQEESSDAPVTDGDGNEMTADVNPMPETLIFSTAHDAMFGSTSGYTVTVNATVGELYQDDDGILWTVEWENPNSTWAEGKSVADYITVFSKYATGTKCNSICTITCSQPFGETVVLKAQLKNHTYLSPATCQIEFRQRVIDYNFVFYKNACLHNVFSNDSNDENIVDVQLNDSSISGIQSNYDLYLFDYDSSIVEVTSDVGNSYNSDYDIMKKYYNLFVEPVYSDYTIVDDSLNTTFTGGLTNSFMKHLGLSSSYYMNGNFSFAPNLFYDTYTGKYQFAFVYQKESDGIWYYRPYTVLSEYAFLSAVESSYGNGDGVFRFTVSTTSDYSGEFEYKFDVTYSQETYRPAYYTALSPNAISLPVETIV